MLFAIIVGIALLVVTTSTLYYLDQVVRDETMPSHKKLVDLAIETIDKYFYCDQNMFREEFGSLYRPLEPDNFVVDFLKKCPNPSILQAYLYKFLTAALRWGHCDANAFLRRYNMFLLSPVHLDQLLEGVASSRRTKAASVGHLLDIGAGNGSVTVHLATIAKSVTVTEMSQGHLKSLKLRGFQVVTPDLLPDPNRQKASIQCADKSIRSHFDTISCLNVLDRCDRPLVLLQQLQGLLSPDGQLILAVSLPFDASVEDDVHGGWRDPIEPLPSVVHDMEPETR
jgi:hypothetical protein